MREGTDGVAEKPLYEILTKTGSVTAHDPKVCLNPSMLVGCYLNYRGANWTSQALTPIVYSKEMLQSLLRDRWGFRGNSFRPFSQDRNVI